MSDRDSDVSREEFGAPSGRLKELKAIRACLDELESHAEFNGASLAANLIGAAAKAMDDEIMEREVRDRIIFPGTAIRFDA